MGGKCANAPKKSSDSQKPKKREVAGKIVPAAHMAL